MIAENEPITNWQVGSTGVNVTFDATVGERQVEGLVMVKVRDDHWGIQGSSLIFR